LFNAAQSGAAMKQFAYHIDTGGLWCE